MEQRGTLDPDVGYWAAARRSARHAAPALLHVPGRRPLGERHHPPDALRRVPAVPGGRRPRPSCSCRCSARCSPRSRPRGRWPDGSARRTGWPAFWVIGLASPLAIYALDFWEHALGLGLMLWGVVWFVRAMLETTTGCRDCGDRRRAVRRGRDDAHRGARLPRRVRRRRLPGVALRANVDSRRSRSRARDARRRGRPARRQRGCSNALALGTSLRGAGPPGTAAGCGPRRATRVARSAAPTCSGTNRLACGADLVLGGAIVAAGRGRRLAAACASGSAASCWARPRCSAPAMLYLVVLRARARLRARSAHRVAVRRGRPAVRLARGRPGRSRVMAVVALPLVWFFQYSGGAGPQWGARYTLLSGALLLVAATVVLEGRRAAFVGVVGGRRAHHRVRDRLAVGAVDLGGERDREDRRSARPGGHLGEPAPPPRGWRVLRPRRALADRGAGRTARPGGRRSSATPATPSSPTSSGTARRCPPTIGDVRAGTDRAGPVPPVRRHPRRRHLPRALRLPPGRRRGTSGEIALIRHRPHADDQGVSRPGRLTLSLGTAVTVVGLSKAHAVASGLRVVEVVPLRLVARVHRAALPRRPMRSACPSSARRAGRALVRRARDRSRRPRSISLVPALRRRRVAPAVRRVRLRRWCWCRGTCCARPSATTPTRARGRARSGVRRRRPPTSSRSLEADLAHAPGAAGAPRRLAHAGRSRVDPASPPSRPLLDAVERQRRHGRGAEPGRAGRRRHRDAGVDCSTSAASASARCRCSTSSGSASCRSASSSASRSCSTSARCTRPGTHA